MVSISRDENVPLWLDALLHRMCVFLYRNENLTIVFKKDLYLSHWLQAYMNQTTSTLDCCHCLQLQSHGYMINKCLNHDTYHILEIVTFPWKCRKWFIIYLMHSVPVTHICVSGLGDNWFRIGLLRTHFRNLNPNEKNSFKNYLEMSSAKCQPFCLNVEGTDNFYCHSLQKSIT